MRTTLAALILAGCGGLKTVDADALADVEPDAVEMLAEQASAVDDAERAVADAMARHEEVSKYVADANSALKSAKKDFERARTLKAEAVGAGDYGAAQDMEAEFESARKTLERRQARAAEQEARVQLTAQNVEVAEAKLAEERAELEHARAVAAAEGGADVPLQKFEKQLTKREQDHADEVSELRELESETGITL
jgi:hypothetical protein